MADRDAAIIRMAGMALSIVLTWVLRDWIMASLPDTWKRTMERVLPVAGVALYSLTVIVAVWG